MKFKKITLGIISLSLVFGSMVVGSSKSDKKELILRVQSVIPGVKISLEGTIVTDGETPAYRTFNGKTPFELKLNSFKFFTATIHSRKEKGRISVKIFQEVDGVEKQIAWTTGKVVVLDIEKRRTSISGF